MDAGSNLQTNPLLIAATRCPFARSRLNSPLEAHDAAGVGPRFRLPPARTPISTLIEKIAANVGYYHAWFVQRRFLRSLDRAGEVQEAVLRRSLRLVAPSELGRRFGLARVRTAADFCRAVPLQTYEDLRPTIERVADGEVGALFAPTQRLLMFATSSGTTAKPKLVPVTPEFVRDYRRGWNTFGIKMLRDHPGNVLRGILQSTGRMDAGHTPSGVPFGAITGLLARSQKGIVRKYYIGRPEIAHLDDARARFYALMRMGVGRDVGFAITANPATLIQMARVIDEESEAAIRDVHDGTVNSQLVPDATVRRLLEQRLRPNPQRAAALRALRAKHGALRPRDYWRLGFLACWTGGSLRYYLQRLADWWGPLPVRDIGLLASEGRITIPFEDHSPVGVLDVTSAFFEFIPAEEADAQHPTVLRHDQLDEGRDYAVVLSNATGLLRYRLDDVVRVQGRLRGVPLLEFLYRAGRVASVAGEKLTENQVVAAMERTRQELGLPEFDFLAAPAWSDPPFYRVWAPREMDEAFCQRLDRHLCEQNEEYAARRNSGRLGPLELQFIPEQRLHALDRAQQSRRGGTAEQYKRQCLLTQPGADQPLLALQLAI